MKILFLYLIMITGFLNLFIFIAVASRIGGDALSGSQVGSHYYLSNHGKTTEVSQAVFTYSLWHVNSLFVTIPAALVAGGLLMQMITGWVNGPGEAARTAATNLHSRKN